MSTYSTPAAERAGITQALGDAAITESDRQLLAIMLELPEAGDPTGWEPYLWDLHSSALLTGQPHNAYVAAAAIFELHWKQTLHTGQPTLIPTQLRQ